MSTEERNGSDMMFSIIKEANFCVQVKLMNILTNRKQDNHLRLLIKKKKSFIICNMSVVSGILEDVESLGYFIIH